MTAATAPLSYRAIVTATGEDTPTNPDKSYVDVQNSRCRGAMSIKLQEISGPTYARALRRGRRGGWPFASAGGAEKTSCTRWRNPWCSPHSLSVMQSLSAARSGSAVLKRTLLQFAPGRRQEHAARTAIARMRLTINQSALLQKSSGWPQWCWGPTQPVRRSGSA